VFCSFPPGSSAQTSTIPVVTIQATDNHATWTGDHGTFTVFRSGNPTPALNVYCCISGTASNGVDYQSIGNWVQLPPASCPIPSSSIQSTPGRRTLEPSPWSCAFAIDDSGKLLRRLAQQRDRLHHAAGQHKYPPAVRIFSRPTARSSTRGQLDAFGESQ